MIFGTTGRKSSVKDELPLHHSCPKCGNNLHLKVYKRWFTFFFIPIFPIDTIDTFYECVQCGSAYSPSIKAVLRQVEQERGKSLGEAKRIYAESLIACMAHMGSIDGSLAAEEEAFIKETMTLFPEFAEEMNETFRIVTSKGGAQNYVFDLLGEARSRLSAEGVLNILAHSARVLLADGKIEKEEESLMKEFLVACGLSKDMYKVLLEKVEKGPIRA
jgi:tellurite resistance protein